jgi:hypothetical protein
LLLDENGLSQHGPGAAGSGEPDDRRQQMEKQDRQIGMRPRQTGWRNRKNTKEFRFRHAQDEEMGNELATWKVVG